MKNRILLLLLASTFSIVSYAQTAQKQVKILDDYIQQAIKIWSPPGLAVTVVKDGEVIFTKGYGVTTVGEKQKVDEHTLFVCASTTKAFTAAAMAMLVDEGKVGWDDHVIDYLPDFQLYDPYMTREITIRDLLTHRTGMGNTDYLWSWMTISGDSALYKMREVKPSYSLRSSFIYQNLMYLAAGRVIEKVSGMSWESFLQERIYNPIGMKETYAYYNLIKDKPNIADAHVFYEEEIIRIKQSTADEIGPAGSMWASISDMGRWIKFLLDNGITNGDTLLSPNSFNELFTPQQIIPPGQFYPTTELTKPNWTTYGLGWFQHDYRGKMVQFHTGSLNGMVAIAGLIPEENIGVYVMSNLDHVELRHAIMYTVFDLFMDNKITTDWSTDFKQLYDKLGQDDSEEPKRVIDTKTTHTDIAGKYSNKIYGTIEISQEGDILKFNLNNTILGQLEHWHYDTYQISFDSKWYGTAMLNIRLNDAGEIGYLEAFGEQFYHKSINSK